MPGLDDGEMQKPIEGLLVQDAVVALHMIDRVVQQGVPGNQIGLIANYRHRFVKAVEAATGRNYDSENGFRNEAAN